jgi:hypothetical protein
VGGWVCARAVGLIPGVEEVQNEAERSAKGIGHVMACMS